jgi:hypothetical protein
VQQEYFQWYEFAEEVTSQDNTIGTSHYFTDCSTLPLHMWG